MIDSTVERQLVRRAQSGDGDAFASLYQTHWQKVYAICFRITRERAEAEDCAQEAFLQSFLRLSTFRGESALSTWLYRLTVNVVLMRLRGKHAKLVPLEPATSHELGGDISLLNLFPVEDLGLRGAVDRIALNRALRNLPRGYRKIFLMHDVEGMAHSEIARKLGCSIGNSKSQLHQARLRLRRLLRRATCRRDVPGGQTRTFPPRCRMDAVPEVTPQLAQLAGQGRASLQLVA
jgi:RNA polymerase sigma-70 factor (ECF subfamily)